MLVVQKYGGSSVGNPEKIKQVAKRIAETYREGHKLVVVVSAMADTTDDLLCLAEKVTPKFSEPSYKRELDVLLSAGERISMALLSMALRDLNIEAISFTGSQAGIITDESHTRARILEIRPFRVQEELEKSKVVIVAGFQGVSRAKEITTLGRGGSDTTAVALAANLKADRCEIWTDVEGIYSADPRIVTNAKHYECLPLGLVLAMAQNGAQVMHAPSVEIAKKHDMSIFVGHSVTGKGTWLVPKYNEALPEVVSIVSEKDQINILGSKLDEKKIQNILASSDISGASLTCHPSSITVVVKDTERAVKLLHRELIEKGSTKKDLHERD